MWRPHLLFLRSRPDAHCTAAAVAMQPVVARIEQALSMRTMTCRLPICRVQVSTTTAINMLPLTASATTALLTTSATLVSMPRLPHASLPAAGTRRSILGLALAAVVQFSPEATSAAEPWPYKTEGPTLYGTQSGILFYDQPLGKDIPPAMKVTDVLSTVLRDPTPAPTEEVNAAGSTVRFNYRVRYNSLRGEIVEASDSIGLGAVGFNVGDGSVNAAVDELVRTLPYGITRRAFIPPSFKLIRKEQVSYTSSWPVASYLEISQRKTTDSNPAFLCSEVDGSCVCDPSAAHGSSDILSKRD